jgi:ABC-type multidrug transport system fused ATPase/permease subunit
MKSPSIFSAIQKLRHLLDRKEKVQWLWIAAFALTVSFLEICTATLIVVFAQVLNNPEIGQHYLTKLGIGGDLSPGRVVFYISITVGVTYLIKNLLAAAETFYQSFSIQKMGYHFKNRLLYRYADADYGFYLTRNSSSGTSTIRDNSEQIFHSSMTSLAVILSESIVFFALVGMIIYINPGLALSISVIGTLLFFWIVKGLLPKFYRWGQRFQESNRLSNHNLLQFFHGFKEIVLLGKKESFIQAYQTHSLKKSKVQAINIAVNNLPRMMIELLFVGIFVSIVSVLCLNHESPIHMLGILGGYFYAGFRLMPGLNRMINQLNVFKSTIPSIEHVHKEYLSTETQASYQDIPKFQFNKSLELKDVSFRYLNTKKDALTNISLTLQKGESIGVIGETGSGKSTLIDMILGLLKPKSGEILIDEKFPVSCYQWHQKIGYVPQSLYLTDDTIAANIAFGEQKVDKKRLESAIDSAQLRKFIDNLPEGAQTIVGERGIRLSGGERQRIAIARALYRNPDVLIFDEATSALDNDTEEKLMKTINAVSKNRTVIMIAHRTTTLKNCDRIVKMEGGSVGEVVGRKDLRNNAK